VNIGYVSEYDYGLDVTFFPTRLQGITSKPVEKSWNGLFCSCLPVRDLIGGEILENGREEDRGGEGGGVSNGRRER